MTRSKFRAFPSERSCPFHLRRGQDGKQALDRVKALKPDLVLLDIHMPVMNGIETAVRSAASLPAPRFFSLRCRSVRRRPKRPCACWRARIRE